MRRRDALKFVALATVSAVGVSVLEACGQAPTPNAPAAAPTTPPAAAKPTAVPAQSTEKKGGTDDVKFSIDRVRDPNTKSPYITYVEKIDSVDVVDKYTVKLNLSKANAVQADELTRIKIMPKEAAADFVNKAVGTGPYQFVEFVPGDHVTMKRFDGYWDQPKPYPEQFIIRVVKDEVAALNGLKSGQFDIPWQLQPPDVKSVQDTSTLMVVSPKMSGNSLILQVDNSQSPFDNKLARQALLYATDKVTSDARQALSGVD
jgi:ABC-type transport system substrate-binding protein